MGKPFSISDLQREASLGRPALIAMVRSLRDAADVARSLSLEVSYRKGAEQLMKRHSITEEEVK